MKKIVTIAFSIVAFTGFAQVVVKNGTTLTIQLNTTFYTVGDMTNEGSFLNNGNLVVSGAWTNNGDYQAENGTVTFNSSSTQIINHNAQAFSKMIISGGGEKIFQADINIKDQLDLQQGLLTTNNHSKIILGSNATISGGSPDSFVQGPVYTTGTGSKTYPVGTHNHYLPLSFDSLTGVDPVIGIEVIEPNPFTTIGSDLQEVSANRYWSITPLSGTFTGSKVTLAMFDENYGLDKVVVAEADDTDNTFHSVGVSSASQLTGYAVVKSEKPVTQSKLAVALENNDHTISVFNAVTPGNNDGKHDFLKIVNIEYYPNNEVTIVNRWGDQVFRIAGYNNKDRVFKGEGNSGFNKEVGDGTYYYVIDKKNGETTITGFFILRR